MREVPGDGIKETGPGWFWEQSALLRGQRVQTEALGTPDTCTHGLAHESGRGRGCSEGSLGWQLQRLQDGARALVAGRSRSHGIQEQCLTPAWLAWRERELHEEASSLTGVLAASVHVRCCQGIRSPAPGATTCWEPRALRSLVYTGTERNGVNRPRRYSFWFLKLW